ncbi:AraC-type DNA-binding protein [Cohnella sp. OV330]|nr:AraC-type DNA-binding protein [Cohnella sp. OV330]
MIGERSYPLQKGTLLFIPPGVTHSFRQSVDQPISAYDLYCDPYIPIPTHVHLSFNPPSDYRPELLTSVAEGFDPTPLSGIASLSQYPELIQTFKQIIRLNRTDIEYKSEIVNSLLYSWLLQWANLKAAENMPDFRIQRIIDLMEQYPGINPPYEQWLELCKLRKSQFYSLFKKMTGLTPKECFMRIKMERAHSLLQDNDRTVTSIAEQLGFSTIHYFSKQFSKYYGVSPSQLRRSSRLNPPAHRFY